MAGDEERLMVLVEARIRDFERNMEKAAGTSGRTFGKMRKDSAGAAAAMEQDIARSTSRIEQMLASTSSKLGGFGKAAIGGFIGGIGVGVLEGIVSTVRDVAKGIAEVGDMAKKAGVDVKSFQELKFVAEQNRIGVDALTDGLKEMQLRMDEFIQNGSGSAAESLKRLGYTASELKEKLKDPSALFTEIIGKVQQLDRAAQIRVMDELFGGTGGEEFLKLLDQGEGGIRKLIQAAHDTGAVMDAEMIQKAAVLDQKFNALATTVGTALKGAILDAANGLQLFLDKFREIENQTKQSLDDRLADLGEQRLAIEKNIGELRSELSQPVNKGRALILNDIAALEKDLADIAAQEQRILDALQSQATTLEEVVVTTQRSTPAMRISEGTMAEQQRRSGVRTNAQSATNFLDLIGMAEGTDKGRGYNETLAYGRFTGGKRDLVLMSLDEIDAMQTQMLRHPDNTFNSSAAGRYQIVQKTLRGLRGKLGLSGGELFDADMQDRLATELLRGRGSNASNLRNEWEGLRLVDAATIERLANGSLVSSRGPTTKQTPGPTLAPTGLNWRAAGFDAWDGLREGNVDPWASLRSNANGLTVAQEAQKKQLNELKQSYQQLGQIGKTAIDGIANALADGKLEGREVLQILMDIAQQLFNMPAVQQGLASIFGLTLGGAAGGLPGFASGTNFAPGGLARINERGGEIVNLPRGSQVIPHDLSKRMVDRRRRAPQQAMRVEVVSRFDADGGFTTAVERISQKTVGTAAPRIVGEAVGRSDKRAPANLALYQQQQAGSDYRL